MTARWCRSGASFRAATWTRCRSRRRPRWRCTPRPTRAPWDDAVTMALNYAGIKFEKVWDAEVLGAKLKTYDWLHLHHEDFTGQYSKFFLNYAGSPWLVDMVERNRAMARQLGFPSVPAEKRAVAVAIARVRRAGRIPLRHVHRDRDARPGARGRRAWTSRRPTPTARRWTRTRPRKMRLGRGARVPERPAGAEPDRPGLLRHRRPPGELAGAPPAARLVHAVQFQRQDRPGGHDAGAEPPPGDSRLLRAHDVVHPEDAQAQRHRAGRRAGRAVGQVHPRRARAGHLDLLRRARSRRPAAPDRRRAHRPRRCTRIRRATG